MTEQVALRLAPMRLGSAVTALSIARESFGGEAAVIALTYGWHALRRLLPVDGLMARSTAYEIRDGARRIGEAWRVTSVIHGRHVVWLSVEAGAETDWGPLLPALLARLAGRRLAVIRVAAPSPGLERAGATPHGWLPGPGGARFWLYSARPGAGEGDAGLAFVRRRRRLDMAAQFHLAYRDRQPVGLTGLYNTSFWPGTAWGGWGALRRRAARLRTARALIEATEALARQGGAEWFLVETSDAPAYRAARRLYELHGLELLVRIDGFFEPASAHAPGEAYLVYGRALERRRATG